MGLIAFVNSDRSVLEKLRNAYHDNGRRLGSTIRMVSQMQRIQETLNYDVPELVILNCSDPEISLSAVAELIRTDPWLHSFGIIGVFDGSRQDEDTLVEQLRDLNVLVLLDYNRIRSHLIKCVSIILENRQLIFQREVSSHFTEQMSGSFRIDNDTLAVPIYAGIPATNMVQMGLLQPEHKMKLQLALSELIVNAIEHGNCGISYADKSAAMERGMSVVDIVHERCTDPAIAMRSVLFSWESTASETIFRIRDEGEGFDVAATRAAAAEQDDYTPHGRGLRLAEMIADELHYNRKGNEVTVHIQHRTAAPRQVPQGFSQETTIHPQPGDVIFREGERGDFLYYISSGHFSVHHGGKQVGDITPADIFMGEMSFLLNNQRSATVVAERNAKLIKITRTAFVEVMKRYPHYGIFLSKLLARKLARSNEERAS